MLKEKKTKSVIVICVFSFMLSLVSITRVSRADEPQPFEAVTSLYKGDKAPFDGILLSKDLASKIEAEKKTMISLQICEAQTIADIEITKSECQRDIELLRSENKIDTEKFEQILEIKEKQLEFYRETFSPDPWYESMFFLVSIGVIAGSALTIGAIYASKSIND